MIGAAWAGNAMTEEVMTILNIGLPEVLSALMVLVSVAVSLALYILTQQGKRIETNRAEVIAMIQQLEQEVFRIRGFRHDDRATIAEIGDRTTLLEFKADDTLTELKVLTSVLQEHLDIDPQHMALTHANARLEAEQQKRRHSDRIGSKHSDSEESR